MNCIAYARVSTDKQAEKELSIPAQLQAMRQYASNRGWLVLEEFVEAGASARTADRPVLRQLLQRCRALEQPKVDVVLVHKLDRLARNLADHVAIRAQLRDKAIGLVSVCEGLEDSVSGQLVEHILASMAEFYSANLSEEVKKGMRQKILQGGWPHRPPRGYRVVSDGGRSRVVLDDVTAPLIRKAFEACQSQGYGGLLELRARLAGLGLVTPSGKPLSNSGIVRILTNSFYSGVLRWKGQSYPGVHPAIVSCSVFEQVQRVLKTRTRPLRRGTAKFLLTGIAQCQACRQLVGGDVAQAKWQYYRCRGSFRSYPTCRAPYFPVAKAHADLAGILRNLGLEVPERLELLREVQQLEVDTIHRLEIHRAALRSQLTALRQREAHMSRSFASGLLQAEAYDEGMKSVRVERDLIAKQLQKLQRPRSRMAELRTALTRVRSAWDAFVLLSVAEQRLLVPLLFEELVLGKTGIVAHTLKRRAAAAA